MKTSEFDYELPLELIAQTPLEKRDESRLLVLDKKTGSIKHEVFKNIINYLNEDDILVVNDTKVIPARLYGEKEETKALIEVLLLKEISNNKWECLTKPAKRIKVGTVVNFGDLLKMKCVEVKEEGIRIFELKYEGILYEILDKLGTMPLPPYIHEQLESKNRYQTVYAKNSGSAAAPTAGLHFTEELLEKIKNKGINIGFVTLHVGLGTFRPVKADNILEHKMHSEHYYMPKETAELINKTKQNGGRVISVGTTSCRTLESVATKEGCIKASDGWTDIFIYPGYKFKCIDGLLTNFHLPESTLIMLVSAFAGYDHTMAAYKTAVNEKYRFYSFGDAMLIL